MELSVVAQTALALVTGFAAFVESASKHPTLRKAPVHRADASGPPRVSSACWLAARRSGARARPSGLLARATLAGQLACSSTGGVSVLEAHQGCVNRLAFSADGATLASVSDDRTVRLWDVASCRERAHAAPRATLPLGVRGNVLGVSFVPVGTSVMLAACAMDGAVAFASVDESRLELVHSNRAVAACARHCAAAPNEPTVAVVADNGSVRLFDCRALDRVAPVTLGMPMGVSHNAIAWHPREPVYALTATDGGALLWDRRRERHPVRLYSSPICNMIVSDGEATFCAFSDDGAQLLVHMPRGVLVFDWTAPSDHPALVRADLAARAALPQLDEVSPRELITEPPLRRVISARARAAADQLRLLGNEAMAAGDAAQAVDLYTQALELVPRDSVLLSNRAAALTARQLWGDSLAAVADAERLVAADPSSAKAVYRLFKAFVATSDRHGLALLLTAAAESLRAEDSGLLATLRTELSRMRTTTSIVALREAHISRMTIGRADLRAALRDALAAAWDRPDIRETVDCEHHLDSLYTRIAIDSAMADGPLRGRLDLAVVATCARHRNVQTGIKEAQFFGRTILAGADDGYLVTYDADSGRLLGKRRLDSMALNAIAISPVGAPLLAVSGIDWTVKMLDLCERSDRPLPRSALDGTERVVAAGVF